MLSSSWPPNDPDIAAALEAAFHDGSWGRYEGPNCERLATSLAKLLKVQHVALCASGTIAVEIALRGVGVVEGDEVVLAGYDFPGNFRAIEAIGARPVLADIDPATWCLDERHFDAVVGPATKAILVSHLHGGQARMPAMRDFADQRGLVIVEDACQSSGAIVAGKQAGTWGDAGVFSFGGSKLLTAGRGGAMFTQRDDVAQRAKIFCDRGNHAFPLSELQAAVLVPQLEKLAERNRIRWTNVQRLLAALQDCESLTPVAVPTNESASIPSFYKLAFRLTGAPAACSARERLIAEFAARQIPIDAGFRGFTTRSANRCRKPIPLPHSQAASDATLILHHPILLADEPTIARLAAAIRKAIATVA